MYNVKQDGITHINMYSKGQTRYGQMLSNFYAYDIHTADGWFKSVEGYWGYLSIDPECPERNKFHGLYGMMAKTLKDDLSRQYGIRRIDDFNERILKAIWYKMRRHEYMCCPEYNGLPVVHYYVYGDKIIDKTNDYPWLIDGVNKLKTHLEQHPEDFVH